MWVHAASPTRVPEQIQVLGDVTVATWSRRLAGMLREAEGG